MAVLANDATRRNNAQAIFDLAQLGWFCDDTVLDLTVGPEAGFWKLWTPAQLITNDSDPAVAADFHLDALNTGWADSSTPVVVWDPPYAYRGTSRLKSDANYGLAREYRTPDQVDELLVDGTCEAIRLASRLALVKCQDANVGSRFRDQSSMVIRAAAHLHADVVGKLYVNATRAQPADKAQLNIWGYHSVLLVFAVDGWHP